MIKLRTVVAPVVLVAGLLATHVGVASAVPVAATGRMYRPTTVSFTVAGFGSGPYDVTNGEFHTAGAFVATRFGPGRIVVDSDLTAGFTAVETFVHGDRMFITNDPTNSGGPLPTNCPTDVASGPYSGAEFITGGTGRFANATGYITYSGCSSVRADPGSPTGYTFSFTFIDKATMTLPT